MDYFCFKKSESSMYDDNLKDLKEYESYGNSKERIEYAHHILQDEITEDLLYKRLMALLKIFDEARENTLALNINNNDLKFAVHTLHQYYRIDQAPIEYNRLNNEPLKSVCWYYDVLSDLSHKTYSEFEKSELLQQSNKEQMFFVMFFYTTSLELENYSIWLRLDHNTKYEIKIEKENKDMLSDLRYIKRHLKNKCIDLESAKNKIAQANRVFKKNPRDF
jgi:hypothetical protein